MTLTRPFAIDQAYANASDFRKQHAAAFPREGVLPDPVTTAAAGIAYPNGGWNIGARIFTAVARRGTAPFSQAYGSALISNDSQATVWTIPAAPATGSRIDLLWLKATDPTQGDATTTPSGETVARAVPVFGVTSGNAATTPSAPALPAGAVEVGRVTTSSTATSVANSVFTHSYDFAYILGAPVYFRTDAALIAATAGPWNLEQEAVSLDTKRVYRWNGSAWISYGRFVQKVPAGTALPQRNVATQAPAEGTPLTRRIQYVVTGTNASGAASSRILFAEPFPNAVLHPNLQTISGSGVNPVINAGDIDRFGFTPVWPSTPNGSVGFTYEVIGW